MRLRHADQVEVLAPAGSMASMRAALNAGADAVYMGGSRFGARAYAENPEETEYLTAIDEVHLRGRKLYLTLNTLLKDREMERELYAYVRPMYEQGLDGVIVQDLGVLRFLREQFPGLPLHASTQMTVTGPYGAKAAGQMGVSRVVPARELTVPEIRSIVEASGLEVEVFIHGALCYCYSGQCFMSSFIGGRSGNRGRCAGPCRLPYEARKDGSVKTRKGEDYVLSLKDLCGLHVLPDLLDAGVYSLKIEGRMKSPVYTAGVAAVYREYADRYLDEGRKGYRVDEKDVRFLKELFDRGGFTDFYYFNRDHFGDRTGQELVARKEKPEFRKADASVITSVEAAYVKKAQQEPISGRLRAVAGEALSLTAAMELPERTVEVICEGNLVETAQRQALLAEDFSKQLNKTGNTPFYWEKLEQEVGEQVFVPMGALNELRRRTLAELETKAAESYRRGAVSERKDLMPTSAEGERREWQIYIEDIRLLDMVLQRPVDAVMLDCACLEPDAWKTVVETCHKAGKRCYLGMPYIFRIQSRVEWESNRDKLRQAGFDGFLVRNVDEAGFLNEMEIPGERIGEVTAYSMNHMARAAWKDLGIDRFLMSVELNRAELKAHSDGRDGILLYGYLPMMVSAGCLQRTLSGCSKKPGWHTLLDRKKEPFSVKNVCRYCYNLLFNSKPLSLHGCRSDVEEIRPGFYRLHFTQENLREAEQILDGFLNEYADADTQSQIRLHDFTRGHFRRGVE